MVAQLWFQVDFQRDQLKGEQTNGGDTFHF